MSNIRGLRDPRKRWVMRFDLQLDEQTILPVLLCYEPGEKAKLGEIRALFAERGTLDVLAWWESSADNEAEVILGVVLSAPGSEEALLSMLLPLPRAEWEPAWQRAASFGRQTVLVSFTANPAVLTLQADPTSWEAEIPLQEKLILRQSQSVSEDE